LAEDFIPKIPGWLAEHPIEEVVAMVKDSIASVSGEGKKVIGVGFCWGTWVFYPAMKAGATMAGSVHLHPSLGLENMTGGSHSELLKH